MSGPAEPQDTRAEATEGHPLPDLTPDLLQALGEEIGREFPIPVDNATLVLMDVDPHRVHAFWHVGEADLDLARQRLAPAGPLDLLLRVHDVTAADAGAEPWEPFDIEVQGRDGHCYVDLWQDGRAYEAELVVRGRDGTVVPLARSNRVATPPAAPPGAVRATPPGIHALHPGPVLDQGTPGGAPAAGPEALVAAVESVCPAETGPAASVGQTPPRAAQPVAPDRGAPSGQGDASAFLEGYFGPTGQALGEGHVALSRGAEGPPAIAGPTGPVADGDSGPSEPALEPPEPGMLAPEFPNPVPGAAGDASPAGAIATVEATEGAWLPPIGAPRAQEGHPASGAGEGGERHAGVTSPGEAHPIPSLSSSSLVRSPGLLEVHAELHVFGWARPGSRLQIFGRPVVLRPDGSFSVRRPLPAGAVVVPLEVGEPPAATEAEPD